MMELSFSAANTAKKTLQIYHNTGAGFDLNQTLDLPTYPQKIGISKSGDRIYLIGHT